MERKFGERLKGGQQVECGESVLRATGALRCVVQED
jgi:hypothetical protein